MSACNILAPGNRHNELDMGACLLSRLFLFSFFGYWTFLQRAALNWPERVLDNGVSFLGSLVLAHCASGRLSFCPTALYHQDLFQYICA